MGTLSGNKVKDTYTSILKLESNGVTSTLKTIEDGAGTDSAIQLSTDTLKVNGTMEVNGTMTFSSAPTASTTELTGLFIDGSNNIVRRDLDSSAFTSGSAQTFANPMLILRPSAQYTLTTTASFPSIAGLGNDDASRSHEVNDANEHLQIGSDPTGSAQVQRAGLVRIEVNFFLTLANNTDVTVSLWKVVGGSQSQIQSITRSGTGNMGIGFSLITHAPEDSYYFYKISRDSSGSGTLETLSTFSVTKLD